MSQTWCVIPFQELGQQIGLMAHNISWSSILEALLHESGHHGEEEVDLSEDGILHQESHQPGETTMRRSLSQDCQLNHDEEVDMLVDRDLFGFCPKWSPVGAMYRPYPALMSIVPAIERDWRVPLWTSLRIVGTSSSSVCFHTLWFSEPIRRAEARRRQRKGAVSFEGVGSLGCSMVLIDVRDFLDSILMKICWTRGKLVVLESGTDPWPLHEDPRSSGWSKPDEEHKSKLLTMQNAARSVMGQADFCVNEARSVCQRHVKRQWRAVSFLPTSRWWASSSSLHLMSRTETVRMRSSPVCFAARGLSEVRTEVHTSSHSRQEGQKLLCFWRPPSPHLHSQHNKPRLRASHDQFRVALLFCTSCGCQRNAIPSRCPVLADPSPRKALTRCPQPIGLFRTEATHPPPLPNSWWRCAISRSRSRAQMLVATRPPASRQILAATLSTAYPLLPRTPARGHPARLWPWASSERPHRQVRTDSGRGTWSRRSKSTRRRWEPSDVMRHVGRVERANPPPGPACDRSRALPASENLGNRFTSRCWRSTLDEASCCQPRSKLPGSWSQSWGGGRAPFTTACHNGVRTPITPNKSNAALLASSRQGDSDIPLNSARISATTRRWRACIIGRHNPTGPVRRAPEVQSSQRQREGGHIADNFVALVEVKLQNVRQTLPQCPVVRFSKLGNCGRADHSNLVTCTCRRTMKKQQPCWLHVLQWGDAVEESLVFCQLTPNVRPQNPPGPTWSQGLWCPAHRLAQLVPSTLWLAGCIACWWSGSCLVSSQWMRMQAWTRSSSWTIAYTGTTLLRRVKMYKSSKNVMRYSPSRNCFWIACRGWCCTRQKNNGIIASRCSALRSAVHCSRIIFPQIFWRSSVKHPDKRQHWIPSFHAAQPVQHGFPGYQIVRADVVYWCQGNSVDAWSACAIRSVSTFVDNAYLKGDVVVSTTFPICWAIVRETNLRTTSPATMPLISTIWLREGCHQAQTHHLNRHLRHVRSRQSGTQRWQQPHPSHGHWEGVADVQWSCLTALLRLFFDKTGGSRRIDPHPTDIWHRELNSWTCRATGPGSAPVFLHYPSKNSTSLDSLESRPLLRELDVLTITPKCTSISALAARCSRSSSLCRRVRRRLDTAAWSSQITLARINSDQPPWLNNVKRASKLIFEMWPPPRLRCSNVRDNITKSFHHRLSLHVLPLLLLPTPIRAARFHTTARELQTRTFEGPGASNITKILLRRPPEREKKSTILGPPPSGPTLRP